MVVFAREHNKSPGFFFWWFQRAGFALSALMVGIIGSFLIFDVRLMAGQIIPEAGPVEIIRGDQSFLVQEPTKLRLGDIIKTGVKSQAVIEFDGKLSAHLTDRTHIQITKEGTLYLSRGKIQGTTLSPTKVLTQRGFIQGAEGGAFELLVSDTGETTVRPVLEQIEVFDREARSVTLERGQSLTLRSDTVLATQTLPSDLELSNAQIEAIRSKISIARTKFLTGLESHAQGDFSRSSRHFQSAEKSFLSIAQVFDSSRALEIQTRKNLDIFTPQDIVLMVKQKNKNLSSQVEGVAVLFDILRERQGRFALMEEATGIESFDRYVLLDEFIQLGNSKQQIQAAKTQETYAVQFLQDIQMQPLRVHQVNRLQAMVSSIARREKTQEFLEQVQSKMSPDLAQELDRLM
jgi:hypothetical protein